MDKTYLRSESLAAVAAGRGLSARLPHIPHAYQSVVSTEIHRPLIIGMKVGSMFRKRSAEPYMTRGTHHITPPLSRECTCRSCLQSVVQGASTLGSLRIFSLIEPSKAVQCSLPSDSTHHDRPLDLTIPSQRGLSLLEDVLFGDY